MLSVGAHSKSASSSSLVAPGKHVFRVKGVAEGSSLHVACGSASHPTVVSDKHELALDLVAGEQTVCTVVVLAVPGAVNARQQVPAIGQDSTNADVSIFVDGSRLVAIDTATEYTILLTISNLGANVAENVRIFDSVDSRFDIFRISGSASNGAVTSSIVIPAGSLTPFPGQSTRPSGRLGEYFQTNNVTANYTGSLPVRGTITITINYYAPLSSSGIVDTIVVNRATVNSTTPDSDLFNNAGSMNITVAIVADLDVSFAPFGPVEAGNLNPYSFTIFACNKGPSIARDVVVNWEVPAVFTVTDFALRTPISTGANCVRTSATTIQCRGFNLIARPTGSTSNTCSNIGNSTNPIQACVCQFISLQVLVASNAAADAARAGLQSGSVVMNASVSSSVRDFELADNVDVENVTVIVKADVVIGKSGVTWVYAGGVGSYIIQVTNAGPAYAYGVLMNDTIPSQFIITNATLVTNGGFLQPGASCSWVGQLLTCPLGDMRPRAEIGFGAPAHTIFISVTFNVLSSAAPTLPGGVPPGVGQPPSPNAILNTGFVFTQSVDVNLTNNKEDHLIDIAALSDVFIAKSCRPGPFISGAGDQFDYVLTVGNRGLSDAQNVLISDPISEFLNIVNTSVGINAPGLTVNCDPLGRSIICRVVGGLSPSGDAVRITLTLRVSPVSGILSDTLVINTATVRTSTNELSSTLADNTARCDTLIRSAPDLSIFKDGPSNILLNDPTEVFFYNITLRNNGPTTAENVGLVDTEIPAAFIVNASGIVITTSEAGRSFSFSGNCNSVLNCQFGSLLSGSTITVSVPFRVLAGTPEGLVTNCANVTAFLDSDLTNNRGCKTTNITVGSDVFITKETDSPCAGDTGTFVLRVGNIGPATARTVVVRDQIDSRFTNVAASSTSTLVSCNVSVSNLVVCLLPDLPAQTAPQITITISFRVPSSLVPANGVSPLVSVTNQASVSTSTFERPGNTANDMSNIVTMVIRSCIDVAVTKNGTATAIAGRSTNAAGVPYTYTITVRNLGPSDATNVMTTDVMPIGFIPLSVSGPCTQGALTISGAYSFSCSWTGTFDINRLEVVVVTYRVAEDVLAGCNYVNIVTASSPGDLNQDNNIARHPVCVSVNAPLTIVKTGPSYCVVAGERVQPEGTGTYVITVTNVGDSRALQVSLTDAVPTPFVLSSTISISYGGVLSGTRMCSQNAANLPSFSCNLFSLNPNESVSVTYSLQVPADAVAQNNRVNTAVASAVQGCTSAQAGACPVTSVTTTFSTNVCVIADLAIRKSHDLNDRFVAGRGPYSFQIVAINNGPSVATDVVLLDYGFTAGILSLTAPAGVNCVGLRCTMPSFGVGIANQITLTASFLIPATTPCGPYTNFVNITSITRDSNLDNNFAQDTISVVAEHTMTITKIGTTRFVAGGASGSHVVTVTNLGPSTATNVRVTDAVPAGLPVTAVSCGTLGQSIDCSFGSLNSGESRTITYTIQVPSNGTLGGFRNTAVVTTGAVGGVCEFELGTGTTFLDNTVVCEDGLAVFKTDNVDTIIAGRAGETFTYVLTVSNLNGPSDAKNVRVEDVWPSQLTRIGIPATNDPNRLCSFADGKIQCLWSSLPRGASVTINQQFFVAANVVPGFVNNTITAISECSNARLVSFTSTTEILNQADLSITKDDCTPTIVAGAQVPNVFTLRVANAGPSDGVNVAVTDFVPKPYVRGTLRANSIEGVAPVCDWQLFATGDRFTCTYARFPANTTVLIFLEVTVPSDTQKGWAHNCARVTNGINIPDPDSFNNEDCDLNEICTLADVAVTKVLNTPVDPDCGVENGIVAGNLNGNSVYVVSVVNYGPSTARNVVFTERFPAAAIILSAPAGCTALGNNVYRCVLPTANSDLPVGTLPVQFSFPFRVAANAAKGLITNLVTVGSDTKDPEACNNNFTLASPVCVVSDLSLTKTDGVSQVTAGDGVVYKYNISGVNYGPSDAAMVVVTDLWPLFARNANGTGGFNIVGVTGANCSDTLNGLICTIGNVPVGGTYQFCISYVVDACLEACTMCNYASVSSMSVEPRPDPHNNSATDCNEVRTEADLEICKSDGVDTVVAGDGITYTYTIKIGNKGPSCARNVALVDHWPANVPQSSAVVTSVGTCVLQGYPLNPQSGNFSCNLGNFTVGQTATVTVSYFVPSTLKACAVVNVATVSSITFDPVVCNNDAKDVNAVTERASLSISKTVDSSSIPISFRGPHAFTIVVTNNGPSTAYDVVVTDLWPSTLCQYKERIITSRGECVSTGGDVTCPVLDIAKGASVTITIPFSVCDKTLVGTVINNATVFSPTAPFCNNSRASVPVTITNAVARRRSDANPKRVVSEPETHIVLGTPIVATASVIKPAVTQPEVDLTLPIVSGELKMVKHTGSKSVTFTVTNPTHVVIRYFSLRGTLGAMVNADLTQVSEHVVATTCASMIGRKLPSKWSEECTVTFAASVNLDQKLSVFASGSAKTINGVAPVQNVASI